MLEYNDIIRRIGRVEMALRCLGAPSEAHEDFRFIVDQFEVEEGVKRLDDLFDRSMGKGRGKAIIPNKHSLDLQLPPASTSAAKSKPKSEEHKKKIQATMLLQHARKRGDVTDTAQ